MTKQTQDTAPMAEFRAICKRVSERICQMDCGFRVRLDGVWVCATCQRVYTDSGDTK